VRGIKRDEGEMTKAGGGLQDEGYGAREGGRGRDMK
jgi:hypothetical protein